ncbi:HAD hydrolase-like protein [Glaciihabitans sp. UYNi722]|uniref:HAD hydrolase-like protein n=1 Tax=Glaciihabitans sp. UYNi722 TaxID=3156344 RepID=UPI00339B3617
MNPTWTCILFDLDGTILDSAPGITSTLAWTFEKLGRPIPTPAELLVYVGPPILDSFRDLAHMSPEESAEALDIYRVRYLEHGVFDSTVYPGIPALLERIAASGLPLSLATSKPELPATTMLDHFGLTQYFDVITGASEDEVRSRKADVVEEALKRLEALGAEISNPVMVGDREHDVEGAAEHGVPTIFVEWGYGSAAEEVGTIAVARTAEELGDLLLGDRLMSAQMASSNS